MEKKKVSLYYSVLNCGNALIEAHICRKKKLKLLSTWYYVAYI